MRGQQQAVQSKKKVVHQSTPSSSTGCCPPNLEKKDALLNGRFPVLKLHDVVKFMRNVNKHRPKVYSARKVERSVRKRNLDRFLKTVPSSLTAEGSSVPNPVIAKPADPVPARRPRKQVRRDPATVVRKEYGEDEWWRLLVVPEGGEPVLRLFQGFQQERKRNQEETN